MLCLIVRVCICECVGVCVHARGLCIYNVPPRLYIGVVHLSSFLQKFDICCLFRMNGDCCMMPNRLGSFGICGGKGLRHIPLVFGDDWREKFRSYSSSLFIFIFTYGS